jgi:hypothetical protein
MDLGFHDAIRATWGQELRGKAMLRFFVGVEPNSRVSRNFKSDEIAVNSGDDYNSLPHKTRAICYWATTKQLDHLFLCDNDTYVNVPKLLSCGYQCFDYSGKISKPLGQTFPYDAVDRNGATEHIAECHPWASGGYGYFLSRAATFLISDIFPDTWAEDLWVGQVLGPEIAKGDLTGFDFPAGTYSQHFPSHEFKSGYDLKFGWMEEQHKRAKG